MKKFLLNCIFKILGIQTGKFFILAGEYRLFYPIKNISKAWIKIKKFNNTSCSHEKLDKISYEVLEYGILFNLEINSNKVEIEWLAI